MALSLLIRRSCTLPGRISTLRSVERFYKSQAAAFISKPVSIKTLVVPQLKQFSTSPVRSAAATSNYTTLWTVERFLSAALLGIIPAAIAAPSQILDGILAVSVVLHFHWGLEAIVTDYVRPIIFGNTFPKVAHGLLLLFSVTVLGGLFYFIQNDIGLGNAIRKLWAIKGANAADEPCKPGPKGGKGAKGGKAK